MPVDLRDHLRSKLLTYRFLTLYTYNSEDGDSKFLRNVDISLQNKEDQNPNNHRCEEAKIYILCALIC
jgi:hypothetical protein